MTKRRYIVEPLCLNTCRLRVLQAFAGLKPGDVLDYWSPPFDLDGHVRLDYRNGQGVFKKLKFTRHREAPLADILRRILRRDLPLAF